MNRAPFNIRDCKSLLIYVLFSYLYSTSNQYPRTVIGTHTPAHTQARIGTTKCAGRARSKFELEIISSHAN